MNLLNTIYSIPIHISINYKIFLIEKTLIFFQDVPDNTDVFETRRDEENNSGDESLEQENRGEGIKDTESNQGTDT